MDLGLVDEEIERGLQMTLGKRHGERVAYIAMRLGRCLGIHEDKLIRLTAAGLLHDIGALGSFRTHYGNSTLLKEHCLVGSVLAERLTWGVDLAPAIKYHHETPAAEYGVLGIPPEEVPLEARILSFADHLDLRMSRRRHDRGERDELRQWVCRNSGSLLFPEVADAFAQIAKIEAFWLDLEQPDLQKISLDLLVGPGNWRLPTAEDLELGFKDELAATFADLIDKKSLFTARHSRSVAETVRYLAECLGWDAKQQHDIYTAGLLHDLGKLSVPRKILDKQGPLNPQERDIIRTHTYYTHNLLIEAGFPNRIVEWAAHHHERLDGLGYPFALDVQRLDLGSRLMTIADMFAALTEDRPYRPALSSSEALEIIQRDAGSAVDGKLVQVARKNLL